MNNAATPCSPRCRCSGYNPNGFANKDLRTAHRRTARLDPADNVTAGQITYDLRRLRARGLITRIPHTHRYTITDHGLHTAMFLSAVHDRFLPTGLAQLAAPNLPTHSKPPPHTASTRKPHHHNKTRRLTRHTRPTNTNLTQNSGFAGSQASLADGHARFAARHERRHRVLLRSA